MIEVDHKQIIIRAVVKKPPVDPKLSIDWLRRLVDAVGMKLVIGPFAHYCECDGNDGITAMCCISTSHASLQAWDKATPPVVHFDLYSCQPFEVETVMKMIDEFEPQSYDWVLIDRNESVKVIKAGQKHE